MQIYANGSLYCSLLHWTPHVFVLSYLNCLIYQVFFLLFSMGKRRSHRNKRVSSEPGHSATTESPTKRGSSSIEQADEEITFNFTATKLRELLEDAYEKAVDKALSKIRPPLPSNSTRTGAASGVGTSSIMGDAGDALAKVIMEEGENHDKPILHITGGLPLDLHVRPKLCEKVMADKYVDSFDALRSLWVMSFLGIPYMVRSI